MAIPIIGDVVKAIGGVIGTVTGKDGLIDQLHTSAEEKLELKQKLAEVQASVVQKVLDYQIALAQQQGETLRAEITGHSWLQRNWRPIVMLFFAFIVGYVFFGGARGLPTSYVQWTMELIKLGLGGYVIGRSAEKIVPAAVGAFKRKEDA